MAQTYYFYDLETSGISPRTSRIMQFAGQRTDMNLNAIGEPHNILIKMTDDVVPDPDAILITGITPQQTIQDGITEADFLKIFSSEIATPDTIFTGFNTVRFDDEFMRFLLYRNFYDAYEWQWSNGRTRWDLLDLVRMTRALRPDGIKWPFDSQGVATNRLELITRLNGLQHDNAHDALSDVQASISVAQLIKEKQPKLFSYLLEMRDKRNVEKLVTNDQPFVYTSGKYSSEFEKTTVVAMVCQHPTQTGGAFVFDLRHDPRIYAEMEVADMAAAWQRKKTEKGQQLPVKTLKYNRCPAVAQLNVLDALSQERLKLDPAVYMQNFTYLAEIKDKLCQKLLEVVKNLDQKQQPKLIEDEQEVDTQLYEAFFSKDDKMKMNSVRSADKDQLSRQKYSFKDQRLQALLPLYKARNFPEILTDEEQKIWEVFRHRKLLGGGANSLLAKFFQRLDQLDSQPAITSEHKFLLQELQLYGQSILPDMD